MRHILISCCTRWCGWFTRWCVMRHILISCCTRWCGWFTRWCGWFTRWCGWFTRWCGMRQTYSDKLLYTMVWLVYTMVWLVYTMVWYETYSDKLLYTMVWLVYTMFFDLEKVYDTTWRYALCGTCTTWVSEAVYPSSSPAFFQTGTFGFGSALSFPTHTTRSWGCPRAASSLSPFLALRSTAVQTPSQEV